MSEYNSSALKEFCTAIGTGGAEAIEAFSRAFGQKISAIAVKNSGEFNFSAVDASFRSPGLLMVPTTEGIGCGILIPKSTGLIPDWCDTPDATGKSKLTTLAQEWGMTLLPEQFFPDDFQSATVPNLVEALERASLGDQPGFLELEIKKNDDTTAKALMVWPFTAPGKAFETATLPPDQKSLKSPPMKSPPISEISQEENSLEEQSGFMSFEENLYEPDGPKQLTVDDLPGFTRSLLKVRLPVAAVLAQARRPIKMILELGVGSVIQFDKSYDSLLDLQVGGLTIGSGEAIKIGDKFGLRIHNILLPEERFRQVEVRQEGEYKKRKKTTAIIGKAPITSLESD